MGRLGDRNTHGKRRTRANRWGNVRLSTRRRARGGRERRYARRLYGSSEEQKGIESVEIEEGEGMEGVDEEEGEEEEEESPSTARWAKRRA